jgi:hypothetical protein
MGSGGAWLVKTDPEGNELWNKTFGFGEENFYWGESVQITSDSGYILAGGTQNFYGTGDKDAWLIKTDANGNRLWNRTFGRPETDGVYSIQQTSDGGYILAGEAPSYPYGPSAAWLIKVAPG